MSQPLIHDSIIPAGSPWSAVVPEGCFLSIIDLHGQQGVDFLCYNADNPEERYHAPNTLKAIQTLKLSTGHNLYSDIARPIFTITHDSCTGHDTIGGCCSAPSNEMLYGVKDTPGCRENFLSALADNGLGRKDIVPNINFFCDVPVNVNQMAENVFVTGSSKPGDYVVLQARMNALAVISNCPQMNNPCNSGQPTEIRVVISSQPWAG
ncbi:MAG: urea carboxylase-associated protein 1 [Parasphingorhabdus sp.]|jgi:urea carboxylase-associated protein 1